jgi:hypothetical protein
MPSIKEKREDSNRIFSLISASVKSPVRPTIKRRYECLNSIWYFQKLATKTLRFSEDFSEERKATPFLYQLFEREKSFHFDALL